MYNNITLNQKESEHMAPFGRGAQQCNGIEKHGSAHTYHQHCHNTITTPQTVTNVKSNSNATFFWGELLRPAHRLSHSLTAAPIVAQKKKWVAAKYVVGPDWPKLVGEVPLQQAVSPVFGI